MYGLYVGIQIMERLLNIVTMDLFTDSIDLTLVNEVNNSIYYFENVLRENNVVFSALYQGYGYNYIWTCICDQLNFSCAEFGLKTAFLAIYNHLNNKFLQIKIILHSILNNTYNKQFF